MAIGDELSVKISAATDSFERGIESAQEKLSGLRSTSISTSGGLEILSSRANDTEGEMEQLGDKASSASRSLTGLTASTVGLSGAFGTLSTVTTASLIPALAALTPMAMGLTTALGGVAAGMMTVMGTGFIAYGESLAEKNEKRLEQTQEKIEQLEQLKDTQGELTEVQQERLEQLEEQANELDDATQATGALALKLGKVKNQIANELMPVGRQFQGLIKDFINSLPDFTGKVVDAMGNLRPFADALGSVGKALYDLIPAVTKVATRMGREMLPTLKSLGGWIAENTVPAMRAMEDATDATVEVLVAIGKEIGEVVSIIQDEFAPSISTSKSAMSDMVPTVEGLKDAIDNVSVVLKQDIIPIVKSLTKDLKPLTDQFKELDTTTQVAAIGGVALLATNLGKVASAVSIASGALVGLAASVSILGGPLTLVAGAIAGLGYAWVTNVGNMRTETNKFIEDITGFKKAIKEAGSGIQSLAEGKWSSGFDSLVSAVDSSFESIETILIGEGDEGGLSGATNKAVTDAQKWLQTEGAIVIKEGMEALGDAAVDYVQSYQDILVGPEGKSGVMTDMVDQADVWLTETAPELLGAACEAIGAAIRAGLIDFTNPLRGKDSEIWDMLDQSVTWLVDNIPQLMVAVGEAIVDGIIAAASGLYDGLVGDSVLKDAISDAGDWLVDNTGSLVGGVGGAIVDTLLNGISGLTRGIADKVGDAADKATKNYGNGRRVGATLGSRASGGDDTLGASTDDLITQSGLFMAHAGGRVVPTSQVTDRGGVTVNGGPTEVRVSVEGDTDVIKNVSAEVVEEKERRAKRQTGGATQV